MGYTCTEFTIDGQVKRNRRKLRLNGNSLDKENIASENEPYPAFSDVASILKRTFLPVGYPDSVRPEYLTYQLWDSVQGMSSYLRSVLTTRSVLAGAGVGSSESTALAAALAWVFRDGVGMIGSLVFAYYYASAFEIYVKEWRYLADILNNIGLTLDLVSSYFPHYYFALTSVSTLCKACCGLIAGATKARISAHFARPGHLADVTAKESTQETAVALCGLVVGMLLAQMIGDDDVSIWVTFVVLLCLHQYSNYQLVRVLVFDNLNPQRCWVIAHTSLNTVPTTSMKRSSSTEWKLPTPLEVSKQETFLRPIYLTYFGPQIGAPLSTIADTIQFIVCNRSGQFIDQSGWTVAPEERPEPLVEVVPPRRTSEKSIHDKNVCAFFACLVQAWAGEEYIIGVDMNGRVVVSLSENISNDNISKAYLVAYYVHRRLNCKLALYGANFDSKHSYLTEVYQYLISVVAEEALQWHSTLHIDSSSADTGGTGVTSGTGRMKLPIAEQSEWNMREISSLYVVSWRHQNIRKSE